MKILQQDAQFFAENGIIDYSLLVGVHNRSMHTSTNEQQSQLLPLQPEAVGTPVDDGVSYLNSLNAFENQSSSQFDDDYMRFYQMYEGGLLSSDK